MKGTFFIVGPTATGKSELAADVAQEIGAEIISADAFQIYRGLDLLTAKPDTATRAKAPHHLIGTIGLEQEMNAERFRQLALNAIDEIQQREKLAIVVGGSGLYIKTLTHGLTDLPKGDPKIRAELNELPLDELQKKLKKLDPAAFGKIDHKNRRRLERAIEICLLSDKPVSAQRSVEAAVPSGKNRPAAETAATTMTQGVFVFRDRDDLYQRINLRVKAMFENGVVEEVRAAGPASSTALQMIGLREILQLLDGEISKPECIAAIQQATRRYAKRQLTWFRHQTNFEPLNLSLLTHVEAVKWIAQTPKAFGAASVND
jgi:tRNA dimethylallyltransferase